MRAAPTGICHFCGTTGSLLHRGVRDRLYGVPGEWNFRRCENRAGGVVWLDPMPIETDLHEAYADYYTHADERSDPGAAHGASSARVVVTALEQLWLGALGLKSARHRIDVMFLDDVLPGQALDVGCGDGRLLAALRDRGWIVEGQETDAAAAENTRRTRDFTVHLGDLRHLALPAASFDAVIMNHVIEHAYDPTVLSRVPATVEAGRDPSWPSHPIRKASAMSGSERPGGASTRRVTSTSCRRRRSPPLRARPDSGSGESGTTPARAGGMLAASRDISRSGKDRLLGRIEPLHLAAAAWYQLLARIAHARRADSGEEAVLKAFR